MIFSKSRSTLFIAPIMLLSFILALLCIKDGHNWGGDFALYIDQARAILSGSVHALYQENKFAVQHSELEYGPFLYPFGFPLLLAPLLTLFGINFIAFKLFCAAFFVASLPLIFILFKPYLKDRFLLILLACAIAFHEKFLIYTSNVLSDLPFFFFTFLSFYFFEKKVTLTSQVLLGLSVFYAYFTRDIGIVLIPTLFIFQIQHPQENKSSSGFWLKLLPYGIFAGLYLFTLLLFPAGTKNHYAMLFTQMSPELLIQNCSYYYKTLSGLILGETVSPGYFLPLFLIAATGGFKRKKQVHFLIYFLLTWVIICAWPALQGERFLFPLIPFFLLFFVQGLQFIFSFFKNSERSLYFVTVLLTLLLVGINTSKVIEFSKGRRNEACSPQMKVMYAFVSEHTNKKDLIAFFKPPVLRLFTGRNAILISNDHFYHSAASYLLAEIPDGASIPDSCRSVFRSGNFVLLSRNSAK